MRYLLIISPEITQQMDAGRKEREFKTKTESNNALGAEERAALLACFNLKKAVNSFHPDVPRLVRGIQMR